MDELNPNHPVTQAIHDHWHKIAAILMKRLGARRVTITSSDIDAIAGENIAIRFNEHTIDVRLISLDEAQAMASAEGGLSV